MNVQLKTTSDRMSTPRYHQGTDATVQVRTCAWCESGLLFAICLINMKCQTKPRSFLATGANIIKRETPLALYKGLGAVLSGIVPKMAIRFASFEAYKNWLADSETGKTSVGNIFLGISLDWPRFHFFDKLF